MGVHNCPNLPRERLDRLAVKPFLISRLSRICTWSWKTVRKKTSLSCWAKVKILRKVIVKLYQSTTAKLMFLMPTIMINLRITQQTSVATKKTNNLSKKTFQSKKDQPFAPYPTYVRVMIWKRQCRVVPYKTLFYNVKLRCRHLCSWKIHIQA